MSQTPAALDSRGHTLYPEARGRSAEAVCAALPLQPGLQHLTGHQAILFHQPLLAALARRCGRAGTMDHLAFFLSVPYFGKKLPHLFLWTDEKGEPCAAVLLNEYVAAGIRTGVFLAADAAGERTVLASPHARLAVAARTAEYLFAHGAHIILFSIQGSDSEEASRAMLADTRRHTIATQTRCILRELPLQSSFDETLAKMGAHTRRNLRCYVRRAEHTLGARFYPHAELSRTDLQQLNVRCSYPVPDAVAAWRYDSAHTAPRGFFSGLRGADGSWLSVVGGRRFSGALGTTSVIDWQMNRTHHRTFSLGTAMRGFLLQNEIQKRHQVLRFEGGTPHSMRSAFTPEQVTDVLLARPVLSLRLLRTLAPLLPAGGLLADTLASKQLS